MSDLHRMPFDSLSEAIQTAITRAEDTSEGQVGGHAHA